MDDCKTGKNIRLSVDDDPGVLLAVAADELIEGLGVAGMDPDAAVGGGAPQTADGVGAVDGVAPFEKDRPGHGRVVIFAGVVHPVQRIGAVDSGGGPVAPPRRRDLPPADIVVVHIDTHSLTRFVDMDDDIGLGGVEQGFHLQVGFGVGFRHGIDDALEGEVASGIDGIGGLKGDLFESQISMGIVGDRVRIGRKGGRRRGLLYAVMFRGIGNF